MRSTSVTLWPADSAHESDSSIDNSCAPSLKNRRIAPATTAISRTAQACPRPPSGRKLRFIDLVGDLVDWSDARRSLDCWKLRDAAVSRSTVCDADARATPLPTGNHNRL